MGDNSWKIVEFSLSCNEPWRPILLPSVFCDRNESMSVSSGWRIGGSDAEGTLEAQICSRGNIWITYNTYFSISVRSDCNEIWETAIISVTPTTKRGIVTTICDFSTSLDSDMLWQPNSYPVFSNIRPLPPLSASLIGIVSLEYPWTPGPRRNRLCEGYDLLS